MRPTPAILAMASLCLAFGACGRSEDATTALPPPPADAPAAAPPAIDVARPINLLGNEPFWALQIRPDGLKFSAPGHEDVVTSNPGPEVSGARAVWTGDAKGQPIRATLTATGCEDGMSGFAYPFKATVEIEGRVLEGCAAYADAMPREGG